MWCWGHTSYALVMLAMCDRRVTSVISCLIKSYVALFLEVGAIQLDQYAPQRSIAWSRLYSTFCWYFFCSQQMFYTRGAVWRWYWVEASAGKPVALGCSSLGAYAWHWGEQLHYIFGSWKIDIDSAGVDSSWQAGTWGADFCLLLCLLVYNESVDLNCVQASYLILTLILFYKLIFVTFYRR